MRAPQFAAAVLVAAILGAGTHALAQSTAQTTPSPTSSPTSGTLAIPELIDRLSKQGYSDINEVERKSDKLYKVKARDAQNRKLEMYVDARSAEVLAGEED
jgi:hypothetical protein